MLSNKMIINSLMIALVMLSICTIEVNAQQDTGDQVASSVSQANGEKYRIGSGDVLSVSIYGRPQLSRDALRVDGNGTIRLPLIEDEVKAACKTESELAQEIAERYLKYLKNPRVEVYVKEFNSKPVAIMGAVTKPGQFQVKRPIRLLELLALAGGPTDKAGEEIIVSRAERAAVCGNTDVVNTNENFAFVLKSVVSGESNANPYINPGEVVTIKEAEQVYVVGNVLRPTGLLLKKQVTITQAIAMAGGLLPDTKKENVRLIRRSASDDTKQIILVNLKAIEKQQAADVTLQPDDIIDVPVNGSKRALKSVLNAVVPGISQLPVRVIP